MESQAYADEVLDQMLDRLATEGFHVEQRFLSGLCAIDVYRPGGAFCQRLLIHPRHPRRAADQLAALRVG